MERKKKEEKKQRNKADLLGRPESEQGLGYCWKFEEERESMEQSLGKKGRGDWLEKYSRIPGSADHHQIWVKILN